MAQLCNGLRLITSGTIFAHKLKMIHEIHLTFLKERDLVDIITDFPEYGIKSEHIFRKLLYHFLKEKQEKRRNNSYFAETIWKELESKLKKPLLLT